MNKSYSVNPQTLLEITEQIFHKNGLEKKDSKTAALSIIEADLRGLSSHGVLRLPIYVKRLQNKTINATPNINIIQETTNTAVIDGDNGLGQIVSQKAVEILIEKASKSNIAAVSVRKSNHYGTAAYWTSKLIENQMIGISLSNVEPLMPPPGAASPMVGNNPLSIAFPAGKYKPIIVDMATSVVPLGKILTYKSRGESIPLGWGVNDKGEVTTDPDEVLKGGSLYPLGGPKGYSLAVAIDILTAVLSQGAIGAEIGTLYQDVDKPNEISHLFMAIKIDAFLSLELYRSTIEGYVDRMKAAPKAPGIDEIYLPGELEEMKKEFSKNNGITVPESVVDILVDLAKDVGISITRDYFQ